MPEMDGLQALGIIRQLEARHGLPPEARAKIFMTTALSEKGKVVEAARSGCDAYLVKPVTKARLCEEITRLGLNPAGCAI